MAHSKKSTSVMFCGSASRELLPIYVVYKAQNVYDTWMENGPPGARYNATPHGWFEGVTFIDWFRTIFVPYVRKLPGTKVIIGDNLSTRFSEEVIELAISENILFICLPPNYTHIAQPLDVAFFAPLKRLWRKILFAYKLKHRKEKVVPKESFPELMKQLWEAILDENKGQNNLVSGFRACGIVPCDKVPVIKKLDKTVTPGVNDDEALNDTVLTYLKSLREPEPSTRRAKKRKVTTAPGLSVSIEDFVKEECDVPKKKIYKRKVPLKVKSESTNRKKHTIRKTRSTKNETIPKKQRPGPKKHSTAASSNVRVATRSTLKKKS